MEIIQICPQCGIPAISVNDNAVRYNLTDTSRKVMPENLKWSICINPNCTCTYFSKQQTFFIQDLQKPLFFKDSNDNVPICYCSDLTRGEIKDAVKAGCKSIDAVQNYTKKDITGYCEERNPLGKCCRNVFIREILNSSCAGLPHPVRVCAQGLCHPDRVCRADFQLSIAWHFVCVSCRSDDHKK